MKLKFTGRFTWVKGMLEGSIVVEKNGVEVYRMEGTEEYGVVLRGMSAALNAWVGDIDWECPDEVVEFECPDDARIVAFYGYEPATSPKDMRIWLQNWGMTGSDIALNMTACSRNIKDMRSALDAWKECVFDGESNISMNEMKWYE